MAVELTVIVKGEDGALLEGAKVTITPGDYSATTNNLGEAQLAVDGANRFQVSVTSGDKKQTVPFYVIDNQPTARLEVNLQYFKQLNESKKEKTQEVAQIPWYETDAAYAGFGVGAIVMIVLLMVYVLRRRHHHESTSHAVPTTVEQGLVSDSENMHDPESEIDEESVSMADIEEELESKSDKKSKKTRSKK